MLKKFFLTIGIVIILFIIGAFANKFIEHKKYVTIQNSIISFLNNDELSENFDKNELEILQYAKAKVSNRYNITDFINNYIDSIDKSVNARINNLISANMFYSTYDDRRVGYVEFKNITDKYHGIAIHGLKPMESKYIIMNITDEDIVNYNQNKFDDILKSKLELIFEHDENDQWIINQIDDKRIELPYNVYIDYISNKRIVVNEIKKFLEIKVLDGELKKKKKKETPIRIKYKFQNIDGKVVEGIKNVVVEKNENNVIKIHANSFLPLYCTQGNLAQIKAGQHDYDEAVKRDMYELDELTAERAKLGLEQTPQMNWDDYDEDGNYIGSDETVSKEEAEEIIKYLNEHGITGIKPSDIKKPQNNDINVNNSSAYDYLTDNETEDIDSNLKIQREMIEELKNKAKESLNDGK